MTNDLFRDRNPSLCVTPSSVLPLTLCYIIDERPDRFNGNSDLIIDLEGELVRGDDPGAGQQEAAVRELILAEEVVDQLLQATLEAGQFRRSTEDLLALAVDLKHDLRLQRDQLVADENARTQSAAGAVDLRLWQIERISPSMSRELISLPIV